MRTFEITLPDEVADTLDTIVGRLGLSIGDVLALGVSQIAPKSQLKPWTPREQWDALVKGDTCSICPTLTSQTLSPDFGYLIADLSLSRFILWANQYIPGYCILTCSKHVVEVYDMTVEERTLFFNDLACAALAISRVFQPIKLNYEILGNGTPHLHCHIKPRYLNDPFPHAPFPAVGRATLTPTEYAERVAALRNALN